MKWPINHVPHIPNWTSSLWWPLVTWPDLDLNLVMAYQVLQFFFLTCWRVLAECNQSALRCLGSWPSIVEACNFDLWPDLDLTCELLTKKCCSSDSSCWELSFAVFFVFLRPFVRKLDWGGAFFAPPPPQPMEPLSDTRTNAGIRMQIDNELQNIFAL